MGAFVGYVLGGPSRLATDPQTLKGIVEGMEAHAELVGAALAGEVGHSDLDDAAYWAVTALGTLAEADEEAAAALEAGPVRPPAIVQAITNGRGLPSGLDTTESLARALIEAWNDDLYDADDVTIRSLPSDTGRRNLIAGDTIYEGEPEGDGYAVVDAMLLSGFAKAAGIVAAL